MLVYASSKSPLIPYVCADVHSIPLKKNSLKGLVLSYSLHEKSPELRRRMISEARKFVIPRGKIIFLDYDSPWNLNSRLALWYITLIEKAGGSEHYACFHDFIESGGLTGFIKQENISTIDQYDVDWASSRIILTEIVR
jgi:ubiquinone/menaquinone biosynthesis C-methylase UbiE